MGLARFPTSSTRILGMVACAWLSLGPGALAQPAGKAAAEPDPRWRPSGVWRQSEGLPQDSVISILQTRDGYVWVGTRAGVSRFDGVRFTTFDARDKSQLRENEVWALTEADDGSLWIGVYGGGLSRLEDGRFTVYGTQDGLADDFVRVLAKGSAGALWVGMDHGVSRFQAGRFTSYTEKEGLLPGSVRAILADSDGSVLVATQSGLQRIVGERIEPVIVPGLQPRDMGTIVALCRDRQGSLWVGLADGLLRATAEKATRYTTADGLSSNSIRRLHEDSAGRLWVATAAGLDRYTGAASASPAFVSEAVSADLAALHSDREGGVWTGHRGAGLTRFHRGVFHSHTSIEGVPDTEITAVLPGPDGAAWVGSLAGLSLLHGGRLRILPEASGMPRATVASLALDRTGRLWVGTNQGIHRSTEPISCTREKCEPRFEMLRDDATAVGNAITVRVVFEDRAGVIWIGTDRSGLIRYESGRVTRFTTADGLSNDAIRSLAGGEDGSLWIGTKGGGLNRLQGRVFTKFTEDDGLPNDSVQALYMDPDQTLWIATRRGVSRYKGGRFTTYSTSEGMPSSHVYSFVEDDRGDLWMASGNGIFRVSKKQLDGFADGRIGSVAATLYGRAHGLPSTMAAVGTYPGASRSHDGRLWFAMVGGLAVADPKNLTSNSLAPPVHIEEVRVDGRVLDLENPAEVPPGRGEVMFRYTALSFEAPRAVKFKYRLEGFDRDWVDADTDTARVVHYTNLAPGHYRFRAIAANGDGVWNEQGAEIAFSQAPHFYETRWFYVALALSLIVAGAATQRLRVKRLQMRGRELSVRVEEAVSQIKVLRGLLPICASCKMIRDDKGSWNQMEAYIHERSEAEFSHGMCPNCTEKLYPGLSERIGGRRNKT